MKLDRLVVLSRIRRMILDGELTERYVMENSALSVSSDLSLGEYIQFRMDLGEIYLDGEIYRVKKY